jgi:hypothetical protein
MENILRKIKEIEKAIREKSYKIAISEIELLQKWVLEIDDKTEYAGIIAAYSCPRFMPMEDLIDYIKKAEEKYSNAVNDGDFREAKGRLVLLRDIIARALKEARHHQAVTDYSFSEFTWGKGMEFDKEYEKWSKHDAENKRFCIESGRRCTISFERLPYYSVRCAPVSGGRSCCIEGPKFYELVYCLTDEAFYEMAEIMYCHFKESYWGEKITGKPEYQKLLETGNYLREAEREKWKHRLEAEANC